MGAVLKDSAGSQVQHSHSTSMELSVLCDPRSHIELGRTAIPPPNGPLWSRSEHVAKVSGRVEFVAAVVADLADQQQQGSWACPVPARSESDNILMDKRRTRTRQANRIISFAKDVRSPSSQLHASERAVLMCH